MRYLTPYRIAAYVLVFFCAGHTAGGMLSQKSLGPGADAVFKAMKSVQFNFNGATVTWYGFWFAFGLMVSVFLLFSAVVAWRLDSVEPKSWTVVSTIAWALVGKPPVQRHSELGVLLPGRRRSFNCNRGAAGHRRVQERDGGRSSRYLVTESPLFLANDVCVRRGDDHVC